VPGGLAGLHEHRLLWDAGLTSPPEVMPHGLPCLHMRGEGGFGSRAEQDETAWGSR
jgi:hypothetical protein